MFNVAQILMIGLTRKLLLVSRTADSFLLWSSSPDNTQQLCCGGRMQEVPSEADESKTIKSKFKILSNSLKIIKPTTQNNSNSCPWVKIIKNTKWHRVNRHQNKTLIYKLRYLELNTCTDTYVHTHTHI